VSEALTVAREALAGEDVWLVGGAVRDRLLGRETDDIDLAIAGNPKQPARRIARAVKGAAFELSGAFGAWRVVAPEHAWHVDLVTLRDDDIQADLAQRDFTINAMAEPLAGGALLDPHGGQEDLKKRLVRMVSAQALEEDPLRSLRAIRIAVELDLTLDEATGRAAAANAPAIEHVANERVFAELKRIVSADNVLRGLR
jgi:tRNA nucleotidyltransferase/poly(A) polymerase